MKKSLLALAVAAALPALGYAQTNIILNGSIDGAVEWIDSDANAILNPGSDSSDVRITDGVWTGSRFAISGTEELGRGLKGIFNIEHRLSADTGTITNGNVVTQQLGGVNQDRNLFWAGQSWVGLQGGFGAIRLGRQYSPMFRALAGGDVTGYSWYNNLAGGVVNGGAPGGWTLRLANDVSYQSPSIGGFTLHAAYAAGEDATAPYDNKQGDTLGIGAVGAFGPINIGLAYHAIDTGDNPLFEDDGSEIGLSLGAKFGNFGVGLAATQTESGLVGADKRKMFFASLSAGLGAGTVYLVGFKDDRGGDNIDAIGATLTYSHGLSKRTFLYGTVGYNKFEGIAAEDVKPLRVALGVRHFF